MRFSPGDLVIKSTGGNKMKIVRYNDDEVDCAWISEKFHEETFREEDLLSISEYSSVVKTEKRDDFINQILSN